MYDADTKSCTYATLKECKASEPTAEQKKSNKKEEVKRVDLRYFQEQHGAVYCQKEGPIPFEADCKHFYNCARANENEPIKGELLRCADGLLFDVGTGKCTIAKDVKCTQIPPNPLLFPPSEKINNAKVAGAEFVGAASSQ